MLVLMDMEWIENNKHYFCPTQISAMRVDGDWNCVDRFDALIRPFDASCHQWDHMAYTGGRPEDFLDAGGGPTVFLNLLDWLSDDDILCWWTEQPALVFQNAIGNILHYDVYHQMRLILPSWRKANKVGGMNNRSPYKLARQRGITVPEAEHVSSNDVEAMRALLQGTSASQTAICATLINPEATAKTQAAFKRDFKGQLKQTAEASGFSLLYDPDKKLLHKRDCPDIAGLTGLKGHSSYKACIKQRLKPCRCCLDDYLSANLEYCQEIIQDCHFNYVYRWRGALFHKPGCIHVQRIPFNELRGGIYYNRCIEQGLKPCGWCKPTIKQEVPPPHIYPKQPRRDDPQDEENSWLMTRQLTRAEQTALKRFEAAQKERARRSDNTDGKTQTELHDEHVLTQTGYAFWAAVGYQTFHLRNCPKLERVSNLRGYARFSEAKRAGLTPCRWCRPTAKHDIEMSVPIYQKERKGESAETLDRLCDAQGYIHRFDAPDYFIETPVGKWRIDTRTQPIDVYHINLTKPYSQTTYHKQPRLFLSLTDTFEYIRRHESKLIEKARTKLNNVVNKAYESQSDAEE